MRNYRCLTALIASLVGCTSMPQPDPVSADTWVDEQIASSAAAISQSQFRLQQTSAAPRAAESHAAPMASTPAPIVTAVAQPVRAPVPAVTRPAKATTPVAVSAPQSSGAPVGSAATSGATAQASTAGKAAPVSGAVTPAKVMPVAAVPPVVEAKIITPPKPLPEPWAVSSNDTTLRRALNKWVQRAGWQLVWDASVDVPINVDAKFTGDFNTAVKSLFQSLSAADVNLSAVLYSGNRVLRVTESGRRAQ